MLAGAVLFGAHAALRRPRADQIVISAAFVEGLREEQRARTGRTPSAEETRALVDRFVEEEILHREALALGLDQGDVIVRRRLTQKMRFLLEDEAMAADPGPSPTAAKMSTNEAAGRARAASISFRHVFLSRDKHGEGAKAEAERLLNALRSGADPGALGDPFLQGSTFTGRTASEVEATFGPAFAEQAFALSRDTWAGPISSSYGYHLVIITDRAEGGAAQGAQGGEELRAARREEALKAAMARLRTHYQIIIEGDKNTQ